MDQHDPDRESEDRADEQFHHGDALDDADSVPGLLRSRFALVTGAVLVVLILGFLVWWIGFHPGPEEPGGSVFGG